MEDNTVSSTSGDDYTGTNCSAMGSRKCTPEDGMLCYKVFPFERQKRDHFKRVHMNWKRYTCKLCFSKSYTTLVGSKLHRERCGPAQMKKHQEMWKAMEVYWVSYQMKSRTGVVQTDKLDDKFAQVIFFADPPSKKIEAEIKQAVEQGHLTTDCVICEKHFPTWKDLTDHYKYYVEHTYKHVINKLAKSNPDHKVWKRYSAKMQSVRDTSGRRSVKQTKPN